VPAVHARALVVTRFTVEEPDADRFRDRSREALDALAARPGYLRGHLGRAVEEPSTWLLVTEWEGLGAYRRALSAYDVKVRATPLLATARDEPSAFEVLLGSDAVGGMVTSLGDRAPDAATAGPRRAAPPPDRGGTA
jgi:heme oxygenase (mycobilin-producing)